MALRQIENQFHGRLRSMVEQAYLPPFPPPCNSRERNWEEITGRKRDTGNRVRFSTIVRLASYIQFAIPGLVVKRKVILLVQQRVLDSVT